MFLIPLVLMAVGFFPFLWIVRLAFGHRLKISRRHPFLYRSMMVVLSALAVWTVMVFSQVQGRFLGGNVWGAHRGYREAWEQEGAFSLMVTAPFTLVSWLVDHVRVLFGQTSAYAEIFAARADQPWLYQTGFYLWEAAPGVASEGMSGIAQVVSQEPEQVAMFALFVVVIIALIHVVRAAAWQRSEKRLRATMRDDWSDTLRQRSEDGASTEEVEYARKMFDISQRELDAAPGFGAALRRSHIQLLGGRRCGTAGKSGPLTVMAFVGVAVVGFFLLTLAVGYLALLVVPYAVIAAPIFLAMAGLVFAVLLLFGVLHVGGIRYIFFFRF